MNLRILLSTFAAALAMAAPPAAAAPEGEVALLSLEGPIGPSAARAFGRRIERAAEAKPRFILIEIDAEGRDVDAGIEAALGLSRVSASTETVAFVKGRAEGAAALVALSCDHLALAPGARLGGGPGGMSSETLALELARAAKERKQPQALAAALASAGRVVERISIDGEVGGAFTAYFGREEVERWPASKRAQIRRREVVHDGTGFLVLDAAQAAKLGFARWTARDRGQLVRELEDYHRGPLSVRGVEPGIIEGLLSRRWVLILALFVGLSLLFVELHTLGLVVPGALGVGFLALALLGGYMAGLTNAPEILLVAIGIVFVGVEVLLVPGLGWPGFAGVACLLVGGFLAFQETSWPRTEAEAAAWREGGRSFIGGVALLIATGVAAVRFLPRSPFLKRIMHTDAQRPEDGFTVASPSRVALLGQRGMAATDLRPAGKIVVADEVLDAVSDGGWIDRGAAVEVIETSENRLVVKKA